uniref:Uncharacterized protein n=1 Tax=viral metagenome TaxID=1070528 RepID=A0A6C0AD79_9ZZZZ
MFNEWVNSNNMLNKNILLDTSCTLLNKGINSVFLIENLNEIVTYDQAVKIKRDTLGSFSYILNLNLKKVIYKNILKKKPINKLLMSCIRHNDSTKIFIDQWIDNNNNSNQFEECLYSEKNLCDLDEEIIKKIINVLEFNKDKSFHNWISVAMGLNYEYTEIRKLNSTKQLVDTLIKDKITIDQLYKTTKSLGFYSMYELLQKKMV